MASLLIKNVTLVSERGKQDNTAVYCVDNKIRHIGTGQELHSMKADEIIDGTGCYLSPGFIDMHIHGVHEYLVDSGRKAIEEMSLLLPRYGVTSFLPSLTPQPPGKDTDYLHSISSVTPEGSSIPAFFVEGPFLRLTGALPPEAIGEPNRERVRALQGAAEPYSLVFAVAPDIAGIETVIPEMTRQGNPVFMTHTAASVEQTKRAIEAGVRHATHFYNVYPVPEETDPGVRPCGAVETVLADPRVSVDFILDGEHVDPIAVQMALQCKGPDRVCLITDANIGAGLPPGVYTGLGGSEVRFAYEGAPARMTENAPHPGSLAGSGLTLDRAVKNAVSFLSLDIVQAIRMVSLNPAHILNIEDHKGKIEIGYDADLVLLNRELEVQKTWVEGKLCYSQSN